MVCNKNEKPLLYRLKDVVGWKENRLLVPPHTLVPMSGSTDPYSDHKAALKDVRTAKESQACP